MLKLSVLSLILLPQVYLAQFDPTITDTVSASADDTYERGNGISDYSCTNVIVRSYTDTTSRNYICGGFRFDNLTIPQGATISAASFRGYVKSEADINCKIYGNDVDSAYNFVTPPHIIGRSRTEAHVSWVATLSPYSWHKKDGLEDIIQEIVNRPGWKPGNSIVLLFIANSDECKSCIFEAWDDYTSRHAQLTITYTSVGMKEGDTPSIPITFILYQNYPNPFAERTTIEYAVPNRVEGKNTLITLVIYDITGRLVRTLFSKPQKPGYYRVNWDGRNDSGSSVASGIYFYKLITLEYSCIKKLVLLK